MSGTISTDVFYCTQNSYVINQAGDGTALHSPAPDINARIKDRFVTIEEYFVTMKNHFVGSSLYPQ